MSRLPSQNNRPPVAWSRQTMYRSGFFIVTGIWIAAPTIYTALARSGGQMTDAQPFPLIPGWLFGGLFVIAVIFGVLWWRENRRVAAIIYPTIGIIDLSVLPLVNPLSLQSGLRTAILRWIIVCSSSLIIIFMMMQFTISDWIQSSDVALYIFVFGIMSYATAVSFYIMNGEKRVDVRLLVQRFSERNGFVYTRPVTKRGLTRLLAMFRPTTTENWRLSGWYRQHQIEIILISRGDGYRYRPVFELYVAGLSAATMTEYAAVQDKLRALDSIIDVTASQDYVIFAQFNEGAYSRAGMSRLFASLDVVIDQFV